MSSLPVSLIAPPPNEGESGEITIIQPRRGWRTFDLAEVWRYREVGLTIAIRDLQVRYKQTLLGPAWAILQPLLTMVVMHVFFGHALGVADLVGTTSYPVFLFSGLLTWALFTSAVMASSASLLYNAHILTKVYFPRLWMPVSSMFVPLVDFALASVVLAGLMVWFGVPFSPRLLLVPLVVGSILIAALGVGAALAAVSVWYRDVRQALPFVLQVWLFGTPVIYPTWLFSEKYAYLLAINPVAGPIEAGRAIVIGQPIDWTAWGISTGAALLALIVGLVWFSRVEQKFADVV